MLPEWLILVLEALAILGLIGAVSARRAAWWAWPAAVFLVPTMVLHRMPVISFDPRVVAALCLVPALVLSGRTPDDERRPGWRLADVLMLSVYVFQALTGVVNRANLSGIFLTPFFLTVAPYLIGRYYLGSTRQLSACLKPLCLVLLVLCVLIAIESLTHMNVYARIGGARSSHARMGLARATGPMQHPIYLGLSLVLMLPLMFEAARSAWERRGPAWWALMPVLVLLGIVCTVSRGPMLAALFTVAVAIIIGSRQWRIPVLLGSLAAGLLVMVNVQAAKSTLQTIAGENEDGAREIQIGDQEYEYTGMDHRWQLFGVYRQPLARAGLLGYGFRLEDVSIDETHQKKFWSIDNHYIAYTLRFGYLGIGLFVGLTLVLLVQLARIFRRSGDPRAGLAGGLFAAILAVTLDLYTVNLSPDFGTVLMFMLGLSVNVISLPGAAAALPPMLWPAGRVALGKAAPRVVPAVR